LWTTTSAERIGLAKGVPKGKAILLKRQLMRRFGGLPSWVEQELDLAGQDELESWGDRILDAETLEDVFGEE
jgi:hypothetical protein